MAVVLTRPSKQWRSGQHARGIRDFLLETETEHDNTSLSGHESGVGYIQWTERIERSVVFVLPSRMDTNRTDDEHDESDPDRSIFSGRNTTCQVLV
jgi:hypothetical protein